MIRDLTFWYMLHQIKAVGFLQVTLHFSKGRFGKILCLGDQAPFPSRCENLAGNRFGISGDANHHVGCKLGWLLEMRRIVRIDKKVYRRLFDPAENFGTHVMSDLMAKRGRYCQWMVSCVDVY